MLTKTRFRLLSRVFLSNMVFGAFSLGALAEEFPVLVGSANAGREIWIENCFACHGDGTAGAPMPTEPDEWRARLLKPRETLYGHAIHGFFGPDDAYMPARGGNESLTDAEVKKAVDYMIGYADLTIKQKGKQ